MDKQIKKLWVKALLSGKYKRATGQLYNGHGYCCLGVLAQVMDPEASPAHLLYPKEDVLPETFQHEFEILNDRDKVPFDMIAGLIDEAL